MQKLLYRVVLLMFTIQLLLAGCQDEDPTLGTPPTETDAVFTYNASDESDNEIVFTSTSSAFMKKWDFGNGETGEGNSVTTTYIFAGEYEVTLTVYTKGGSASSKQKIVIEETDLSKLPEAYRFLTGGAAYPEGKTWVIDSTRVGHMGVGPVDAASPIWWQAPANDKSGAGLYNDKHTFKLNDLAFVQNTKGDVFINTAQASNFPGSFPNKGDYTAPFNAPAGLKWSLTSKGETQSINIIGGGFIGYYTGVATYEILAISDTELFIKYKDAANGALAWFLRLIPEGFEPPPPATSSLPLTFEGVKPPFNGFGGSSYDVVTNPSATGINTSSKVAKYVKGLDGNWAGIETTLSGKLDFTTNNLMKYKVYSPVAGKALFKIETTDNSASPIEVFANVTKVNEWEEITFDFSSAPSNTYNKIALFLDFDNNNGGTFYLDDISQASAPAEISLAALTGGSSKTWKINPAAGSFGVGPTKGSMEWWPGGADISGDRPCLFNDEFIFKTGNVYEYDSKGDLWGEGYMGLSDGCTAESNLPANAASWGSGTHSFTFVEANGSNPATITVTGTGAFIALPKAKNGGEYTSAPPDTNGSVTYEVLGYTKNSTTETMTISVNIGSGFWTFVLVSQ